MQQMEILSEIEETFAGVVQALSAAELESNRNLLHKTKKVVVLLAKIPPARKENNDGPQRRK